MEQIDNSLTVLVQKDIEIHTCLGQLPHMSVKDASILSVKYALLMPVTALNVSEQTDNRQIVHAQQGIGTHSY